MLTLSSIHLPPKSSDCATNFGINDKRASTASIPAKWASHSHVYEPETCKFHGEKAKRNSHVEFEIFPFQTAPAGNGKPVCKHMGDSQNLASASENYGNHKNESQPARQVSGNASSRGRIAGYLATKLSNLTSLASGGGGAISVLIQQNHFGSSSAPPSPLTKRDQAHTSWQGSMQTKRPNRRSSVRQSALLGDCNHFYLTKDFGGCDFVLLVESTSKSGNQANSSGGQGTHTSTTSSSSLVIHLVAPNLQEKAAWMSDISQVSFGSNFCFNFTLQFARPIS